MIVVSLAGWFFASAGVPAQAAEQEGNLEVTKTAYWTNSLGEVAPNVLTTQFPPVAVCLVVSQFCTEDAEQITGPINAIVKSNQPEKTIPVTPVDGVLVPEGTLPTSTIAGARRYHSALNFELPSVPEEHKVDEYTVTFSLADPTFHFDSPAFRQFVTGVLALAREDTSELPKTREREPMVTDEFVGVEACPIVVDWKSGDNQPAKDAPAKEGGNRDEKQEINCTYGANGKMQGDSAITFDLTLAANAWAEGRLDMQGILLRPSLPPNLAYGDPDLSTWEQISFVDPTEDASSATFSFATSEKPKLIDFGGFPTLGGDSGSVSGSPSVAGETVTSGGGGDLFGSPAESSNDLGGAVSGGTAGGGALTPAAPAGLSNPATSGWVWFLLPLFLGGMYLTSQAFTAEGGVLIERSGAMTRLIRLQEARAAEARLVD